MRGGARAVAGVAVIAAVLVAVVGCTQPAGPAYEHPAARAVDSVLELRSRLATDPADYAPYFAESAIATELAMTSRELSSSPIPRWEPPYASEEGTSSVDVVVRWIPGSGGTAAGGVGVVFTLEKTATGWTITDAQDVVGTPPPPLGER